MQGDREACLAAGMDDYISKPVTLENLREVLDRLQRNGKDGGRTARCCRPEWRVRPTRSRRLEWNARPAGRRRTGFPDRLDRSLPGRFWPFDRTDWSTGSRHGDLQAMRQAAHTLKGSSGNLGASVFCACALKWRSWPGRARSKRVHAARLRSRIRMSREHLQAETSLLIREFEGGRLLDRPVWDGRISPYRLHRLGDQDAALSRLKPEFESPWGAL